MHLEDRSRSWEEGGLRAILMAELGAQVRRVRRAGQCCDSHANKRNMFPGHKSSVPASIMHRSCRAGSAVGTKPNHVTHI